MTTTYTQRAIESSIRGGWKKGYQYKPVNSTVSHNNEVFISDDCKIQLEINIYHILLDPLFWQALSKAEGWKCPKEPHPPKYCGTDGYLFHWHRLIDHINSGQDIESFFASLLKD